ncbi:MAG: hypothetical protein D6710_10540 [Nitrospirae bacterium]|nr:MAG: hypothetical protein D6710_10540 [Nitrospirota bacterium]
MRIEHYSFGRITVDGKTYSKDVIIFPDRVLSPWWRKEGHSLCLEDLAEVLKEPPEVLVIGKGYAGVMRVPDDTLKALRQRNIEVIVQRTTQAVRTFNQLEGRRAIAALHLTC